MISKATIDTVYETARVEEVIGDFVQLKRAGSNFKGLSPISVESTGSLYKYFYASEKNYDAAKQKLEEAKQKGYSTAFIVAYKDGIKISVTDAIK